MTTLEQIIKAEKEARTMIEKARSKQILRISEVKKEIRFEEENIRILIENDKKQMALEVKEEINASHKDYEINKEEIKSELETRYKKNKNRIVEQLVEEILK